MAPERVEREHAKDSVDEVETPRPEPTVRRASTGSNVGSNVGSTTGTSGLVVGAANDRAEIEADRVAADVIARLHAPATLDRDQQGASDGRSRDVASPGRVQRSTAGSSAVVGEAGGELDGATSAEIGRARGRGAPLDTGVRSRMESGFGTDFGRVRLHTGTQASRLNESMQAQAFTVGSDVFLHDRAPSPDSPAGEHLLAHELTHTLQQSGGASRQVHRLMWDAKTFSAKTSEGFFTGASSAQKAIAKMLDDYHRAYPAEQRISLDVAGIDAAVQRLAEMRKVAEAWMGKHTVELEGEKQINKKRSKRRAGMDGFIDECNSEILMLKHLAAERDQTRAGEKDVSDVAIVAPSERFKKVTAHYEGDASSAFRKLGHLIDMAAPLDGDKTSLTIEVKVPIPPGYVGLEIGVSAERDDKHVEVSGNVGVTGGATVDVASIGAALGGYVKAKAKTGKDAAELLSYGLFRRCRQSNMLPREIENGLWGGANTSAFGWAKAEEWSLGVEKRILGEDDEAEVETGGYGKAGVEVELSKIAGLEFSVAGTLGTKINKESLEARKGGAGERNRRSGKKAAYARSDVRGAQKSVGVGTAGLEIEAGGSFGPFSGSLTATLGWTSDGAHGKKTISFDTFEIGGGFSFEMPMNEMVAGGVGNRIPMIIEVINKMIRTGAQSAEAKEGTSPGAAVGAVGNYAASVAELAALPSDAWSPFADAGPDVAGTSWSSTTTYSLGISFDFKEQELSITIDQSKAQSVAEMALDAAGDGTNLFKLELERTSRLLKLTYKGGKWQKPS